MMGMKERSFAPLTPISLEEFVPQNHFYRSLEQKLDLSFVRKFVQETYAGLGRPSIDPVVFFKLQVVMFFEGIRSERQLVLQGADRLSVRWYLGYDLDEPLPDHSSLSTCRCCPPDWSTDVCLPQLLLCLSRPRGSVDRCALYPCRVSCDPAGHH